jgi:hypothetical protein
VFEPLDFLRDDVLLEFGETWVGFLGRRSVFRDLHLYIITDHQPNPTFDYRAARCRAWYLINYCLLAVKTNGS